METNEKSRFFPGRYFPADEPEFHFMPVVLKDKYVKLYADPRFQLPLYEAVSSRFDRLDKPLYVVIFEIREYNRNKSVVRNIIPGCTDVPFQSGLF